jgi:cell division protein FtsB
MNALKPAGRLLVLAVAVAGAAFVAPQFERIVARNLDVSRELSAARGQVADLHAKEQQQQRTIERLSDPEGAVPAIHERLRLVGPGEELIYLQQPRPRPAATSEGER